MRPMKYRLLTPGPTPVPEDTLLEMAKPVYYHRSSQFHTLLAEVLVDLQQPSFASLHATGTSSPATNSSPIWSSRPQPP